MLLSGDWLFVDVHVQTGLLCARDMKRRVAVVFVALNASAGVFLATYVAHEFPASAIDVFYADDRLEEYGVGKMYLGYPDGAYDVTPQASVGLLECAVAIRTENAVDGARR